MLPILISVRNELELVALHLPVVNFTESILCKTLFLAQDQGNKKIIKRATYLVIMRKYSSKQNKIFALKQTFYQILLLILSYMS